MNASSTPVSEMTAALSHLCRAVELLKDAQLTDIECGVIWGARRLIDAQLDLLSDATGDPTVLPLPQPTKDDLGFLRE